MDMLRYLYGDKNISVADFSKLGFFQIFEKIKNKVDTAGVILYNNPCRSPKRLFRVGSIAQLGEHLP